MKPLLAALIFAPCLAGIAPICAGDEAISNACFHLDREHSGEYTLSIPADRRSVHVVLDDSRDSFSKLPDGRWRAGRQIRSSIFRLVLRQACESGTNGQVVLNVSSWGKRETNSWQFSSTGRGEALYAVGCLCPEQTWVQEMEADIPKTAAVAPLRIEEYLEILTRGTNIVADPNTLGNVQIAFDQHRAEITARFARGLLFYPRASKLPWEFRMYRGGLNALSGCSDRMFAANFLVQFTNSADASWTFSQVLVDARFKGE